MTDLDTSLYEAGNAGSIERYLKLVDKAEQQLRGMFVGEGLADALYSDRYWHIRTQFPAGTAWGEGQLANLVRSELRVQVERFRSVLEELRLFLPLADRLGTPLVLDTNVFVHFDPFREMISYHRWQAIVDMPGPYWLVVPVLVLDEINRRSHTGDRTVNRRARAALAALDPFVDALAERQARRLRPDVPWMRVEVLPDQPSHRRQPDADIELLDRAEFVHQITGGAVTVVTADRGMRVRGTVRHLLPAPSGVRVVAMPEDLRVREPPAQARRGEANPAAAGPEPVSPVERVSGLPVG